MDRYATSADIASVFTQCQPGDVLHLSGQFGLAVLQARSFSTPLTIDASAANIGAVVLKALTGAIWKGGHFIADPAIGRPGIAAYNCLQLTLDGIAYAGNGALNGIDIRDSTDVTLIRSRFDRPKVGVTLWNVTRGLVTENLIWGWQDDGIGFGSCVDSTIEHNTLAGPLPGSDGVHVDGIQGYVGQVPNQRVTVRGNIISGAATQGVFVNLISGYPAAQGTVIEDNVVHTADAPNGIRLEGDLTGKVTGNRVGTRLGSKWQTTIYTTPGVTRTGNVVAPFAPWPAIIDAA
jgi:hypothetical protein